MITSKYYKVCKYACCMPCSPSVPLQLCCRGTCPQGLGSGPRPRYRPKVPKVGSGTSEMSPEVPKYQVPLAQKQETFLILGTLSPDFGDFEETPICKN